MRTYSSRKRATQTPSDQTTTKPLDLKRKPLFPSDSRPTKRVKSTKKHPQETNPKQKLLQLHFCIDQSVIRKCPLCGLRYTKGAKEDMELHRVHCIRVQKGLDWGREEEKEGYGTSIVEIEQRIKLKNRRIARIISFPTSVTGKMGSKLATLLETVNVCLSSPTLGQSTLQSSKVYLFLVAEEGHARTERIAGCVIAQRITTAMAVIPQASATSESCGERRDIGGIFCYPEPLHTPMGISRLFVSSAFRRQGIAQRLLSAAASTFIPGCVLNPKEGQVAFSQPTGDGAKVMQSWGEGHVRIYEEE